MAKEKKIKEAWGELYESVKENIDDNGWFSNKGIKDNLTT